MFRRDRRPHDSRANDSYGANWRRRRRIDERIAFLPALRHDSADMLQGRGTVMQIRYDRFGHDKRRWQKTHYTVPSIDRHGLTFAGRLWKLLGSPNKPPANFPSNTMPEIQAFRGVRYNLGHVGSLSDVVAPPYDVIGPELQDELYRKQPLQRHPPDPQQDRAGRRRRGQQPLHPRGAVPARVASGGRALHRARSGHLRLSPGVHRRGRDVQSPRLHGPACGSRGSARARSFRTKRPCPARRSIG